MAPSGVNDTMRMMMGGIKRFYNQIGPTLQSAGAANAQTLTHTVARTAYVAGDLYGFTVGTGLTNTGATTLDVDGLGAKNIFIGANPLVGGELRETQFILTGYDGTQFQLLRPITPANAFSTPANPTGTTSTTGVMMGLAGAITPKVSGTVKIWIVGDGNNSGVGDDFRVQIRYGTGSAPANAAALTGTTLGGLVRGQSSAGLELLPFALLGQVSGLTVATAYWVDVGLRSGSGGTATIANISMLLEEVGR